MAGRTRSNVVTNFSTQLDRPVQKGDLVQVVVDTVYPHSLAGTLIGVDSKRAETTEPRRTPLTLR